MVRKRGFEPPLDCSNWLLRLARLPFRHFRTVVSLAGQEPQYTAIDATSWKPEAARLPTTSPFHSSITSEISQHGAAEARRSFPADRPAREPTAILAPCSNAESSESSPPLAPSSWSPCSACWWLRPW